MSDTSLEQPSNENITRRDFLTITAYAVSAVGVAALGWPLLASLGPDAGVLAAGSIKVDLSNIKPGESTVVTWRGKPVFISRRTPDEIVAMQNTPLSDLIDPEPDSARVKPDHPEWLVMVGICTHLGCIPIANQGDYEGWFCPCHGSHYDKSGRIRKGPAPLNMEVPEYSFIDDNTIQIG